jgi:hypothetical protein
VKQLQSKLFGTFALVAAAGQLAAINPATQPAAQPALGSTLPQLVVAARAPAYTLNSSCSTGGSAITFHLTVTNSGLGPSPTITQSEGGVVISAALPSNGGPVALWSASAALSAIPAHGSIPVDVNLMPLAATSAMAGIHVFSVTVNSVNHVKTVSTAGNTTNISVNVPVGFCPNMTSVSGAHPALAPATPHPIGLPGKTTSSAHKTTIELGAKAQTTQSPFKLSCVGFANQNVVFVNSGPDAVPAGTVVQWQLPAVTKEIGLSDVTFSASSGYYEFKQTLAANASLIIALPSAPPPTPASNSGVQPLPLTSVLVLGALRTCNVGLSSLAAMGSHVTQIRTVTMNSDAPVGLSVIRENNNSLSVTWAGGAKPAHFYVYSITSSTKPSNDYKNWPRRQVVDGNTYRAVMSIPPAPKSTANFFVVCAAKADSTIIQCSTPFVEVKTLSLSPINHQLVAIPVPNAHAALQQNAMARIMI